MKIDTNRWLVVVLVLLAGIYLVQLFPLTDSIALGFDNASYLLTAKALASGQGYRFISEPGEPTANLYPILFPFLLSLPLRFVAFNEVGLAVLRLVSLPFAIGFLLTTYALAKRYFSPSVSLLVVLMVGLQPMTVGFAVATWSEMTFSCLLMLGIWLLKQADDRAGRAQNDTGWLFAGGVCLALSLLTRTAGIGILGGAGAYFLHQRQWRRGIIWALGVGVTWLPWLIWSKLNVGNGGSLQTYYQWAADAYSPTVPLRNIAVIVGQNVPSLIFSPLGIEKVNNLVTARLGSAVLPAVSLIVGLMFTALFLIGGWILFRRRDIISYILAVYLLMVILYPYDPSRFLMPLYALLLIATLLGARYLSRRLTGWTVLSHRRPLLVTFATVMILGSLLTVGVRVANQYIYHHQNGQVGAKDWAEYKEAYQWIRDNTPPDAHFVTLYSHTLYLFTARKAIWQPMGLRDDTQAVETVVREQLASSAAPLYLFATKPALSGPEIALQPAQNLVAKYPQYFRKVWSTSDETKIIYKVAP